jgi:oligogalacturonide transport system permease protein
MSMELKKLETQKQRANQKNQMILDKITNFLWVIIRACLITGISFIILYPVLMRISVAFKDRADLYNPMVVWIPHHFTLENVYIASKVLNYFPTLMNSLILSGATMFMTVISCALAGYGFARFKFKGNNILFAFVILTILIPAQTLMVPMYMHFRYFDVLGIVKFFNNGESLNLMNSYWPIIMTTLTATGLKAGLFIYIFRQFFRGMPNEIEEASIIDGAGVFKTFFKVMLPNAFPAIITVMLFSFVWQYNDVYYSNLFMNQSKLMSLMLATIGGNTSRYINDIEGNVDSALVDPVLVQSVVDTGILIAILPLIVLYIFVQRWFVESVERTGIVG